jgi:hypothetical protein
MFSHKKIKIEETTSRKINNKPFFKAKTNTASYFRCRKKIRKDKTASDVHFNKSSPEGWGLCFLLFVTILSRQNLFQQLFSGQTITFRANYNGKIALYENNYSVCNFVILFSLFFEKICY